jgi:hypothetical protein
VLSVTDALAQSRAGDASYVGCSTQRIQVERRWEGDQLKEAANSGGPNTGARTPVALCALTAINVCFRG